jgi:hypothetical protein
MAREQDMKRTRRNHTPAFKAKAALAALKGEKTLAVSTPERKCIGGPEQKCIMDRWRNRRLCVALGQAASP